MTPIFDWYIQLDHSSLDDKQKRIYKKFRASKEVFPNFRDELHDSCMTRSLMMSFGILWCLDIYVNDMFFYVSYVRDKTIFASSTFMMANMSKESRKIICYMLKNYWHICDIERQLYSKCSNQVQNTIFHLSPKRIWCRL